MQQAWEYEKEGMGLQYNYGQQAGVRDDCNIRTDKWSLAMDAMDRFNNYKLNEYLKKGEVEAPKATEDQTEGGATEPNPTRDN